MIELLIFAVVLIAIAYLAATYIPGFLGDLVAFVVVVILLIVLLRAVA